MNAFKQARKACNMTQTELAALVGVTRNAVSYWEQGATMPSSERLPIVAKALNVTVDYFFGLNSK